MEKDFANIITAEDMNVGYMPGSNKVLFIKTGQGGSIYGYENKYLDLAFEVNEKYDFSVFVSATTIDTKESFLRDIKTVEDTLGTTDFEIYYMGVSKGGLIGIWHGCDESRIVKMVSINAPLMINYHGKTLPGIKKLGMDKLTMVYGSLDPSYKYVPFVDKHANVQIIEGADHNLIGASCSLSNIVEEKLYV
jgi:hypothetical protein